MDVGSTSWPPAWSQAIGPAPRRAWPSLEQLTYAEKIITVGLLVLALPWLIGKLFTHPGKLVSGLGHPAGTVAGG